MPVKILQAALLVLVPALMMGLEGRSRIVRMLSPVVFCYLAGIIMGNQPFLPVDAGLSLGACRITIVLAIPLLLFSLDLPAWLKLARPTIVSFLLILVSVLVVSLLACMALRGTVAESPKIAGMLVGVYTGGTANMAAIGTALGVDPETFMMINAADIVMGALYLPFLFAGAGRLLGKFLPVLPEEGPSGAVETGRISLSGAGLKHAALGVGLAAAVVACAALLGLLFPERAREGVVILAVTTLAVAASFVPGIRSLPGTGETGLYLLLVFCVAIGSTADFGTLLSSTVSISLYTATVMYGSIVLHLVLCTLLRIDRDTVIITSTAAIFGPAFVGPVAVSLRRRSIIFSGIATGLVGYAAGNYLGLGLAWLLM